MVLQMDDEPGLFVCRTPDRGRISCQYIDDTSEYSGQWDRILNIECGCCRKPVMLRQ